LQEKHRACRAARRHRGACEGGPPADGLIAFAKREGITHVIFGQSARTRFEILLKGSTLNRFLEEVRDATIQVVPLGSIESQ
jgi:two-component system sensor histidine kinase KdpD